MRIPPALIPFRHLAGCRGYAGAPGRGRSDRRGVDHPGARHAPAPSPRPALLATRLTHRFGQPVEEQLRAALHDVGWDGADLVLLDPESDAEQAARALRVLLGQAPAPGHLPVQLAS